MMPANWVDVARIMVQERPQGMINGAERARSEAENQHDGFGRLAAVRRQLGAAMIRAGERVQGIQRPETAPDWPYGALHIAR